METIKAEKLLLDLSLSPHHYSLAVAIVNLHIAQVWTGTSREPIYFNGLKKERVFENAFLENGSMVSMTAPIKRKLFFLTDLLLLFKL